jgi:hypothetical protein
MSNTFNRIKRVAIVSRGYFEGTLDLRNAKKDGEVDPVSFRSLLHDDLEIFLICCDQNI